MDKQRALKRNHMGLQGVVSFVSFRAGVGNGAGGFDRECGRCGGGAGGFDRECVLVGWVKTVGPLLVVLVGWL